MVAALSYALCVNFIPSYRIPADQIGDSSIGLTSPPQEKNPDSDGVSQKGADLEKAQALEVESMAVKPDVARDWASER